MSYIIEDYSIENDDLLKNESIYHTANGYLGVRGNFEEGYCSDYNSIRGTYINAFHEISKITYSEKLHGFPNTKQNILNIIDAQTIELFIDDERFSLFDGEVLSYKRAFDLKEGFTKREICWKSNKGHIIKLNIKRMVSFHTLELFLISYEVESVNYNGKIKLVSRVNGDVSNYSNNDDPRVSSKEIKSLNIKNVFLRDNIATISAQTKNSKLDVSCSVFHKITNNAAIKIFLGEKEICAEIDTVIGINEKIKLDKYSIYTDSLRYDNSEEQGRRICSKTSCLGADFHFEKQKEYLIDFWNSSDVMIEGNKLLREGIHYNIYQLLQAVGKDKFSNISAKGLSGEGYEGHYFWDTEIYMFPFYLLTQPEIAKNLLLYRYGILKDAKTNAKMLGHKSGALFPWRTITGGECSGFFPAGTAQYHINADIAYSFIKYYQITGDIDFTREYGAEVMFETARLWMDTGHFKNGIFSIEAVTGPDEYTCIVNNNYYTNLMAKYNLKWAHSFYNILKENYKNDLFKIINKIGLQESEIENWERAYKNMYLPYDKELDINPQDDSFLSKAIWDFENTPKENYPLLLNYHPLLLYRHQVCKQADTTLAHFLLEDEQALSTIKNSFDYYEKITTHDSSLSSCIFSAMASRVGYYEKAHDYFMESVRLDLDDTHGNTRDGIHTANMGGAYLAIVYGFAGFRIKDDGISFRPSLPKGWESYSFKIKYRENELAIKIDKEYIEFNLVKGEGVDINLFCEKSLAEVIKVGYNEKMKNERRKIC